MSKRMTRRKVTKRKLAPVYLPDEQRITLRGWLVGRSSHLAFDAGTKTLTGKSVWGCFGGYPLYRLAKAIVRHWEDDDDA